MWFKDGHVTAYDGGLGIRLALDLGVECGVPGRPLLGVLGTSSLKEVGISILEKEVALVIKLGRSKTKLNVLDSGRDPWAYPLEHDGKSQLSAVAVEALRSVLIAKASSPTRLDHHGVSIYSDGADIDFYATCGKTIAQVSISDAKARLPKFVFLPRTLAEQIVALCPTGATLTCATDHFAAVGSGVEVCSNVLDTTDLVQLPSLLNKRMKTHPKDIVPLPTGLEAALDRAEVLAGAEDAVVEISIGEKAFRLTGRYPYGTLDEELTMEEDHPAATLKVDAAVLRRGLLASDAFSATNDSLAFYGGETFMYVVAART